MSASREPLRGLALEDVAIRLGARLLFSVSCHVEPGEIVTIVGESGSGKSTLLACVGGFLDPAFTAGGRVLLDGRDLTGLSARERHVGLLFQDDLLFPHLTVRQNLLFAIPRSTGSHRVRIERSEEALADAGLAGFGDRDPATLSGGQRSRVALMRMLLSEPRALLLDEPFSRLDPERRSRIRTLVFDKARASGLPTLLVTHDREDAESAGGPVIAI